MRGTEGETRLKTAEIASSHDAAATDDAANEKASAATAAPANGRKGIGDLPADVIAQCIVNIQSAACPLIWITRADDCAGSTPGPAMSDFL
jgi:hypothetical protein